MIVKRETINYINLKNIYPEERKLFTTFPNSDKLKKIEFCRKVSCNMNKIVEGRDAQNLLELLNRIDQGYTPTREEEAELKAVKEVYFMGFNLNSLPDSMQYMSSLRSLNVSFNQLAILPESIGNLSALQSLDASHNQLTILPEIVGSLSALQSLDASYNQLTILPETVGSLSVLRLLDISFNRLTILPETIGNLSALQTLYMSDNELTALPETIQNLTGLERLDVSSNLLTAIPASIGKLSHLKELNVCENQLKTLPKEVQALKKLERLDIDGNQIREFPAQILALHNLKALDLSSLSLHQLPANIMKCGLDFKFSDDEWIEEGGIRLFNTILATQPISLFMQPRELIQAYFDAHKVGVNEGKVIFLGDGNVGKSYTIQRILHDGKPGAYKTDMTPGISINRFPVEQKERHFDIQFWDFGGQEVMHAMHRCFLTHRTCYVVMVTDRQPDLDGRARYWLRNIDSFASGSDVLLVVNHWEDYASNEELNYNQLHTDFSNLLGSITVSAKCASQEEFYDLTEKIIDMASKLDSTSMEFPKQWDHIRQELMQMAEKGTNYIDQNQYFQICENNGLEDANIRKWLLEWFNDLGTCFSYHQDAAKQDLTEYKVLNPRWLTNAIYILILNGRKFTKNGVICREGIEHLLENPTNGTLSDVKYNTAECGYVLEVMRKFTLSYAVSKEEEFIPALCPNETPKDLYPVSFETHLKYEREYAYLPDSVVHQLMIYCYRYLKLDKCWRKGMCIELPTSGLTAVISMGSSDRLLTIDVYSYGCGQLWELLQPILDAVERINDRLNLKAKDYVWPETIIDGQIYTDRFELDHLLSLKQGNKKRLPKDHIAGKEVDHSIDDLLYRIYGEDSVKDALSQTDHEEIKQKRPIQSVLSGASLSNCVIVFGDGNQHLGISKEILQTIVSSQPNTEFLTEFARLLVEETNEQVKALGETMMRGVRERKPLHKVLSEYLDPVQKMSAISSGMITVWPHVWPKLQPILQEIPTLAAKLGDLISKLL